jgi:hypothetical protein
VPDKPTSKEIRREAEKVRATATKLIEHAKTLIERSAELEKQVSYLNRHSTKRSNRPETIGEGNPSFGQRSML